jgi:hypothetical protein
MCDTDQLPALREVSEDRLLECATLAHEEAREVEGLVVSGDLIITRETVDLRVLIEPVEQQIVLAPVARVARRDPVEPLEVRLRIAGKTIVA